MNAKIKEILLAKNAGDTLTAHSTASLKVGKGIVGDRYYAATGTFSESLKDSPAFEVTLIEQEQIDSFNATTNLHYSNADFRRNIVTVNIDLNNLVDNKFYIGSVKLKGIILCEPCAYLATLLGQDLIDHMTHKAGLRAQIIIGGNIAVNDKIIMTQ